MLQNNNNNNNNKMLFRHYKSPVQIDRLLLNIVLLFEESVT